jgi:dipeptidyl aminopeptidase/acylaminoacyl peptidase
MKYIKIFIAITLTLLVSLQLEAKRNFTFQDAMKFEMLRSPRVSYNGSWFGFEAKQDRGDIRVCIYSTQDTTKFNIPNGKGITFSNDSKWAAMTIVPTEMETENKDKKSNKLKLINLQTKEEFDEDNLTNFAFSEDSKWFAYKIKLDNPTKPDKMKEKNVGVPLKLKHLSSGTIITIDNVSSYMFDTLSNYLFYIVSTFDGSKDGVYYRELKKEFAPERKIISDTNRYYGNLTWNKKKNLLAFYSAELNEKGKPQDCSMLIANVSNKNIDTIILAYKKPKTEKDTTKKDDVLKTKKDKKKKDTSKNEIKQTLPDLRTIDTNWYLPKENRLSWNDSNSLLYFGMKPVSERYEEREEIKFKDSNFYNIDTLLKKSEVYIWGWNDPLIMTAQQKQWNKEKDRTYLTVYNPDTKKYIQLADTTIIDVYPSKNDNYALASTDKPYKKEQTWYGDCEDVYVVNLNTGEKTKVNERAEEWCHMSVSGNYVVYYKDKHWHLYDVRNNTHTNITQNVPTQFYDIYQDVPSVIGSNNFGGWVDNDKGFFLYDNWDIWYFDVANLNNYRCFTQNNGKKNTIKYTLRRINTDIDYFQTSDTLIVMAFNKTTKDAGIYNGFLPTNTLIERIPMTAQFFRNVIKPKEANKIFFAKEKYNEFPNYYLTDITFKEPKRISDLNLNILDTFNWGYTELVQYPYKTPNGRDTTLLGYLVLPDNYDKTKKYPVFVYFYDQMSDRMNRFYQPELTHRPVNQIYMDNYIMFFPDISYGYTKPGADVNFSKIGSGRPGQDAFDCIIAGCRYLANKEIIDTNKSCLQGHSWGGYQTAYIATQPSFFSAACAGAPVGNMTSAYSGIRLESGRVRMFQYEAQQSRIGGSIFDSLQAYINNSPVFFANKSTTPLLIGHGDIDEAVPYQQSIELYMSFRRAQKPTWLLQYVNEPHWQGRYWNKLDYSVKMKEFFDHYCLGTPAPDWLTKGQPYKGENWGK